MPSPQPNESESTFIDRCIPMVLSEGTAENQDQAYAICQDMWDNSNKEEKYVEIQKQDSENKIVKGVVYEAGNVDTDGETMTAEMVRKAAWDFLAERREKNIDISHNWQQSGCYVVESYYTGKEGHDGFPPNSWVMSVKCSDEIWEKVEKGELNGFSFGGTSTKFAARVLLEVAREVIGNVEPNLNKDIIPEHDHSFVVYFDKEGNIVKGVTDINEEHWHDIVSGTATGTTLGHSHRVNLSEDN